MKPQRNIAVFITALICSIIFFYVYDKKSEAVNNPNTIPAPTATAAATTTIQNTVITQTPIATSTQEMQPTPVPIPAVEKPKPITTPDPLSIDLMRTQMYPGSDLKIEQTLTSGNNYNQFIASYLSDGLKIYGLLTIPTDPKPEGGWPVIIFNHGYINPYIYNTTVHYELYVQAMASDGYIVFKPDYRGNGNSEGKPTSTYFEPDYTIDALNALATLKKYPDANPNKIGMWGHSDGGDVILRSIVVNTTDIKAAVIWGGVVAPYIDLTTDWQERVIYQQPAEDRAIENKNMKTLLTRYGTPKSNPIFWNSIDPMNYLQDIKTPIQLDTGGDDEQVPVDFSATLENKLIALGKITEYYNYPGLNHNIALVNIPFHTEPYPPAMQHTLDFFDTYLK